jgi:hypothetical protein
MIRAACRSVIFAFGQATRRTQEHPGSANNKPQVVEAAEAAAAADHTARANTFRDRPFPFALTAARPTAPSWRTRGG